MGALRWILQLVLVVLLIAAVPLTVAGNWVDRQVFNTDAFIESVGPLASNAEVQTKATEAVMAFLDDAAAGKVEGIDKNALKLAAGATYASQRDRIQSLVELIISSQKFDQAFTTILTGTHVVIVDLLENGDSEMVKMNPDGMVVLDLSPVFAVLVEEVSDLGIGDFSGAKLDSAKPPAQLQIELFKAEQLAKAQTYANALDTAAFWLIIVTAVASVLYVVVAKNKGWGLFGLGAIVLAAMGMLRTGHFYGRDFLVKELPDPDQQKALAVAVYNVTLHTLLDWIQLGFFVGAVMVIIGFLWSRVRKA